MGTVRYFEGPGEFVISKQGHNANDPALEDKNKIFDMHWAFANQILHIGYADDWPEGSGMAEQGLTSDPSFVFNVPDFGFRPAIYFVCSSYVYEQSTNDYFWAIQSTQPLWKRGTNNPRWIGTNQISLPRAYTTVHGGGGAYIPYYRVHFIMMAV